MECLNKLALVNVSPAKHMNKRAKRGRGILDLGGGMDGVITLYLDFLLSIKASFSMLCILAPLLSSERTSRIGSKSAWGARYEPPERSAQVKYWP